MTGKIGSITASAATDQKRRIPLAALLAIGCCQVAWMFWILSQPLPNAANGGGLITRSYLLWRFLPEVVPGVAYRETFLANFVDQLSHVENLHQRVPIVAAAILIFASAVALGRIVLRILGLLVGLTRVERFASAFGIGVTFLASITLIAGRMGWLHPWTVRSGLGLLIAAEGAISFVKRPVPGTVQPVMNRQPSRLNWSVVSLFAVVFPFLLIMALGSMLPTIDFDAIEYHVQGPKEYFQAGRISFLSHNVYTSMPFAVEMLHLLGMEVWNDWWWGALTGQLLVASFAPMAGLMIWLTASRWGSQRAAWVATVAYLSTPWIYRLAAIPYVEGPLCFFHAALLWATGRAWEASKDVAARYWVLVGFLAGAAMATKYPALISAVVPFGAVSLVACWRNRTGRPVITFSLGVLLVMSPWLVKNVIDTGNPVYPLGYKVFGGSHWDAEQDAKWANAHGPRPLSFQALRGSVLEVAGLSDWQSPAFTALVPLAFIGAFRRRGSWLYLGFVAYVFLTWWLFTHRLDRFWLPLLPALAILAGRGADAIRQRGWVIWISCLLGLAVGTNLIYCSTSLAGLEDWTGNLLKLRHEVPRMLNPPLVNMELELAGDEKPILIGQAAVFHINRPVIYNTVFNKENIELLSQGKSTEEIRSSLTRLGVTHLYVDWHEIGRYRSPGNYGFTPYVTPELLRKWVADGLLSPPRATGTEQELYRVRPPAQ